MDRTISVSGSATVATSPDVADVRLGVSLTRETVGDARTAVAAAMTAVLDALRSTGIEPADIRTTALSLDPHYQYDPAGQQSLIGYQATNVVTVTVREMGRIAAVIDGALGAGATSLDSLSFRIADPGPLQAEARRAAVDDARKRADTLAQAAGVEIAGVVSIAEIEPGGVQPHQPLVARFRAAAVAVPTPIEAGSSEVSITVAVVYEIDHPNRGGSA